MAKNPPVFPKQNTETGEGMTLRDYFAAKALQGVLANLAEMSPDQRSNQALFARDCYMMADAMLAERAK